MARPRWMQPAVPPELAAMGFERYERSAFKPHTRGAQGHCACRPWTGGPPCRPSLQIRDYKGRMLAYCEGHARESVARKAYLLSLSR